MTSSTLRRSSNAAMSGSSYTRLGEPKHIVGIRRGKSVISSPVG